MAHTWLDLQMAFTKGLSKHTERHWSGRDRCLIWFSHKE
jgi:hypothetical protein